MLSIDDLEKKIADRVDAVDEGTWQLERGMDKLGGSTNRRPTERAETDQSGPDLAATGDVKAG